MTGAVTGGCQCGAVRFRAGRLGGAAICHCRMCQKAFGGFFGPLVSGYEVVWTRGAPGYFQSSDRFRRGFCAACGTPLTYERIWRGADEPVELAIGALDDPHLAPPSRQVRYAGRLAFFDGLTALPARSAEDEARLAADPPISFQHPDHDTAEWRGPGHDEGSHV